MAGRINEEDIATIRERARIEDIVETYVRLKRAGAGGLTGLCPFHDEKTPSFHVAPARGFYHCFGCGEGGDVISFVQKINNYSFTEAIEHLADKVGVQLRYEDGPGHERGIPGARLRILAANQAAAEFYSAALLGTEALPGRQMLAARGFDRAAAEHFGVGWAPRGGRELGAHLRKAGFREDELIAAGLMRNGGWDFFQGRVLWPIRDAGQQVLGFGARKIFDDDRMPAKYINTPETPVYKKSTVLYGLDLARRAIGSREQAVVVEGYTDVMACHLAGVETAVASCGTAFGEEHARTLQRLMGSEAVGQGEVIFTFDGDEAGQAAARKVFKFDQVFTSQTYVAVDPDGLDPCDVRMQRGDVGVRDLVARRMPLYRFVMHNVLAGYDLDRADSQVAALRAAAPLVGSVRDKAMAGNYARELAGMLGMPVDEVRRAVANAGGTSTQPERGGRARTAAPVDAEPTVDDAVDLPHKDDRTLVVERDCAKLLVQAPTHFTDDFNGLSAAHFFHPAYRAIFEAATSMSVSRAADEWQHALLEALTEERYQPLVVELAVEPLLREASAAYVDEYAAKLQLMVEKAAVTRLKSKLQRVNPVENSREYRAMFDELMVLEGRRRELEQRCWRTM